MANEQLVIPAGVRFTIQKDGVSIEYAGDIVLQGDHEDPVARVVSHEGSVMIQGRMQVGLVSSEQGSVTLDGEVQAGEVQAGETLTLHGAIAVQKAAAREIRVLGGSLQGDQITAGESLELRGNVQVNNLSARSIRILEGTVTARAIQASLSAELGPATLEVDILLSPTVSVDPHTTGRVAVIESDNDLGPNGLRGAFRLAEFAAFTGQDSKTFLRERNVGTLDQVRDTGPSPAPAPAAAAPMPAAPVRSYAAPAPTPVPMSIPVPAPAPTPVAPPAVTSPAVTSPAVTSPAEPVAMPQPKPEPTPIEEIPPEPERPAPVQVAVPVEPAAVSVEPDEVDNGATVYVEDDEAPAEEADPHPALAAVMAEVESAAVPGEESTPVAVEEEDMVESAAQPPTPDEPSADPSLAPPPVAPVDAAPAAGEPTSPIARELLDTVDRIVVCYENSDVPPAVNELRDLISAEDYDQIRSDITSIWNSLLKYHQQTGTRLQHQVTTTFNTINSIVRKMDRAG